MLQHKRLEIWDLVVTGSIRMVADALKRPGQPAVAEGTGPAPLWWRLTVRRINCVINWKHVLGFLMCCSFLPDIFLKETQHTCWCACLWSSASSS